MRGINLFNLSRKFNKTHASEDIQSSTPSGTVSTQIVSNKYSLVRSPQQLDGSGGSVSTIRTVGSWLGRIGLVGISSRMDATVDSWILVVIPDVKTESCWINVAMTPEQKGPKDWLGEEIQDTVKDGLGIRRDDVATLADAPRNRI